MQNAPVKNPAEIPIARVNPMIFIEINSGFEFYPGPMIRLVFGVVIDLVN